jgi:hypothetical protein
MLMRTARFHYPEVPPYADGDCVRRQPVIGLRQNVAMLDLAGKIDSDGFAWIAGPFATRHDADEVSSSLVEECRHRNALPPLSVIGDFVLAPLDAGDTRDFQTLHFDFGLPLAPRIEQDFARYTALYMPVDVTSFGAVTRLVHLVGLLNQRSWPPYSELVERLASYGRTHGAWDDDHGYVEASLARIIEGATAEHSPLLPSVKADPSFLCGLEFDSLCSEEAFFELHGLRIDNVEICIDLQPGELLVFDNLAMAHGRRGTRKPGELRQRMYGHSLQPEEQKNLRNGILKAFCGEQVQEARIFGASVP